MSIDKQFTRELKRFERIPQRALYRQTMTLARGSEKKLLQKMSGNKKQVQKKKIAKEVIWFFGSLLLAFLLGFIIYYIVGEFFPETFIEMSNDLGSILVFFYIICIICFAGIYISRAVIWAVKLLTT